MTTPMYGLTIESMSTVSRPWCSICFLRFCSLHEYSEWFLSCAQVYNISCADAAEAFIAKKKLHGDPAMSAEEAQVVRIGAAWNSLIVASQACSHSLFCSSLMIVCWEHLPSSRTLLVKIFAVPMPNALPRMVASLVGTSRQLWRNARQSISAKWIKQVEAVIISLDSTEQGLLICSFLMFHTCSESSGYLRALCRPGM